MKYLIPIILVFIIGSNETFAAKDVMQFNSTVFSATSTSTASSTYEEMLEQVTKSKFIKNDTKRVIRSIDDFQESYFKSHGYYWQGLSTHSVLPQFNYPTVPDMLDFKPDDVDLTWNQTTVELPETMAFAIQVHTFQAPTRFCPQNPFGYYIILMSANGDRAFTKFVSDSNCSEAQPAFDWQ